MRTTRFIGVDSQTLGNCVVTTRASLYLCADASSRNFLKHWGNNYIGKHECNRPQRFTKNLIATAISLGGQAQPCPHRRFRQGPETFSETVVLQVVAEATRLLHTASQWPAPR